MLTNDLKDTVKRNTALTYEQFEDLLTRLPSLQNTFKNASRAASALYMYLMKMRTGLPSEDIGTKFGVTRTTIERQLSKVREVMKTEFVYNHINYIRSRDDLIQASTIMSRGLFCSDGIPRVMINCDATYIYIHKSRNYQFQKLTYNDQKKRNFLKIMMCVTCDGTIVYALGPYSALDNDAKIIKSIFENTDAFDHLQNGDIFILDRGFRDCVSFLRNKGFDVKMPGLVQRSDTKSQLSTAEANRTRLVTAIRFFIEVRNGHMKSIWKIFNMSWNSLALKHLKDDIEICSALINYYRCSIESNRGIADGIVDRMLNKVNTSNDLSKIVNRNGFQNNMRNFLPFEDFDSLPTLTQLDLIYISLGRYQIKQAASYCQEHLKQHDNQFAVFMCPEEIAQNFFQTYYEEGKHPILLFAKFSSRFRSAKKHQTIILIDSNGHGEDVILGYCCSCYNGLRTVGCCSHVMCMIWYSLFIKNRNIPRPAGFLDHYFDTNEDAEEI